MIDEKVKAIISRRCGFQDEDYYGIEKCWIDLMDIMRDDMDGYIDYLLNRCTANELAWLGDSFEYTNRYIQNEDFVSCLKELADIHPVINEFGFISFIEEI